MKQAVQPCRRPPKTAAAVQPAAASTAARGGLEHIADSPRALAQRLQIGRSFGPAGRRGDAAPAPGVLQRRLTIDNPDGTQPAIHLTRYEDFERLQPGRQVHLQRSDFNGYVQFVALHDRAANTVVLKIGNELFTYWLATDEARRYRAGKPQGVTMTLERVVNGEALPGAGGVHCGLLFGWTVQWPEGAPPQIGNGVLVTEVVTPVSASGWFAQAGDRRQTRPLAMRPHDKELDFLGISASKAEGMASTETPTPNQPDAEAAQSHSRGEAVVFQHFEYLDDDGQYKKLPQSGFLVSKTMADGRLTVNRQPAAGQGVLAGAGGGQQTLVIDFGGH